jgi:hypothetical protein
MGEKSKGPDGKPVWKRCSNATRFVATSCARSLRASDLTTPISASPALLISSSVSRWISPPDLAAARLPSRIVLTGSVGRYAGGGSG